MTHAIEPTNGEAASVALHLVCAVSDKAVLHRELLSSEALAQPRWPVAAVHIVHGARSAADAANPALLRLSGLDVHGAASGDGSHRSRAGEAVAWVVWVHQDVRLPGDWAWQFGQGLVEAQRQWPALAVAGVYGLTGWGEQAVRAGDIDDRGTALKEPTALPCLASSLDELLVAVRADSGLLFDAALGFDFYATDLCLQAQERGLQAAVVHAPVMHASSTPRSGVAPRRVLERIARSADAFEHKWAAHLPVFTPCFEIRRPGDVRAFIHQHFQPLDDEPS